MVVAENLPKTGKISHKHMNSICDGFSTLATILPILDRTLLANRYMATFIDQIDDDKIELGLKVVELEKQVGELKEAAAERGGSVAEKEVSADVLADLLMKDDVLKDRFKIALGISSSAGPSNPCRSSDTNVPHISPVKEKGKKGNGEARKSKDAPLDVSKIFPIAG